jgi:hypothetical protein
VQTHGNPGMYNLTHRAYGLGEKEGAYKRKMKKLGSD